MLSTKLRLQLQEIADRIALKEEVSLADMQLIQKHANFNRTVYEMLRQARRRAIHGTPENDQSMDYLLDRLNLGNVDPSTHLTGPQDIDDLADFFKSDNNDMRRD
jgi:hypothetical protein